MKGANDDDDDVGCDSSEVIESAPAWCRVDGDITGAKAEPTATTANKHAATCSVFWDSKYCISFSFFKQKLMKWLDLRMSELFDKTTVQCYMMIKAAFFIFFFVCVCVLKTQKLKVPLCVLGSRVEDTF